MNDLGTWVDFSSSAGSLDSIKTHYEGVITFPGKLQDIHSHFHPFPCFLRKLYRLEQVSFSSSHYYYFYFIFLGYKCLSRKPNHSSSVAQKSCKSQTQCCVCNPRIPQSGDGGAEAGESEQLAWGTQSQRDKSCLKLGGSVRTGSSELSPALCTWPHALLHVSLLQRNKLSPNTAQYTHTHKTRNFSLNKGH